ncbi:MAG: polysaccharide deacetylase family protein [Elusimicrobia bacterium]|nr:polysaccharide deacetylase family protein [Elusimicrobiota bacterium]
MGLKHLAYRWLSRFHKLADAPRTPKAGQRVLLFHSVGTKIPGDPYGLAASPEQFRGVMDRVGALRELWRPAPFSAPAADRLEVAIVFDDGFKDTLTTAAPILAERGIPFTVFVTAGFVKGGSPVHLSPEELKRLAQLPGAQIGAHGFSHARLDRCDDAALAKELLDSRKYLEDAIGKAVTTLSYPHGAVDRRVAAAARKTGYALGGTSRYGLNVRGRDPLLLCRTEITAFDSPDDLELKLRGHWDWFRHRHPDPAT